MDGMGMRSYPGQPPTAMSTLLRTPGFDILLESQKGGGRMFPRVGTSAEKVFFSLITTVSIP